MSFLLKDPDALLDYAVDWGADYLAGDALASSSWAVSPDEPGGVSIASSAFDLLTTSVQVAGGEPGKTYRVSNLVTTASGRRDSRSVVLRVEKR
ncbi:hypothetical protein [Sphingomonas arenae]|uniref:phage fiber-tail adaptor protein n=1 Tax=Sphingomonas arenae TaxID=2812555 RepID=UPI001967D18F|nr:hypothetical protein [Sphingomonas arenae]